MTRKIFSAHLKGLSKHRMAFFFLKYLFLFKRYWHFSIMQIKSVMTYCLRLKMSKYWINNISRNIKAVFLKLGTINVTVHEKTYLNAYPLDGQKRLASVSYPLESFLKNFRDLRPHLSFSYRFCPSTLQCRICLKTLLYP